MTSRPTAYKDPIPGVILQHRFIVVVGLHALIFAVALFCAFALAYNFRNGQVWIPHYYLPLLCLAVPIKLIVFQATGQYRGSWRYVGLRDLFSVISASLIGSFFFLLAFFGIEWGLSRFFGQRLIASLPEAFRQAVFPLDWAATVGLTAAIRVVVRFYHEEIRLKPADKMRRVLVVGAGPTGETLIREILRAPDQGYTCVGLLDDDKGILNQRIHGVDVLGRTKDLRKLCIEHGVQEVLIALPTPSPRRIRALVESCEGLGVLFRTVPPIGELIAGRVQVSQIREVEITDLLGRDPVELDTQQIGAQLTGRRVLVTGAGGSIGSELCRQIARFDPARLILIERAENNLFEIDRELRKSYRGLEIVPLVADIADRPRIERLFEEHRPPIVFHAAAHKHVPMMEINSGEAVKNNILGTMVIANAAAKFETQRMVMISTDKAVNPTSIMGCTKRVAEMYVQGMSPRSATQFITVRFGNVLGSSGSVVPIFRRQIAEGGPVTVTHPEMTRYFMTIPEAAQLVMQAGTMGNGGEIYVLHMGEPVRIVDLARDMITLSGLTPEVDIEIAFTGIRPGEKLYEELSGDGEDVGDTPHAKIGIWKHRHEDWDNLNEGIARLIRMADEARDEEIKAELRRIVPEYATNEVDAGRQTA